MGRDAANIEYEGIIQMTKASPLPINNKPPETALSGSKHEQFPVHTRRREALERDVPLLPPLTGATP